jgi:hypothetical protein
MHTILHAHKIEDEFEVDEVNSELKRTSSMYVCVHVHVCVLMCSKVKQSLYRPLGFQEVEAPRFQDSRHMKVVRLSALCTGHLPPPPPQEIFLVLMDPRAIVQLEGLCP